MRRWLRTTLPPDVYIAGFVLLYLLIDVVPRLLGADPDVAGRELITLALAIYAGFRVFAFHPVFLPDYRNWLASTPWTSRLPLPVGPVHFVFQDLVIVAGMLGLVALQYPGTSLIILMFWVFFVYVSCLTVSFALLRMRSYAYILAFGLGLLVLFWAQPVIAAPVVAVLYLIALFGLRRALREFDQWDVDWMNEQPVHTLSLQKMVDRMRQNILGWPFDTIRPKDAAPSIPYLDGVLVSLLAGWWVFVIMQRIDRGLGINNPEGALILIGMLCQVGILARLGAYCWGYAPPISVWGRLFTLRWVIPGYDQVFVAPVLALAVTITAISPQVRTFMNVPVTIEVPVAFTLLLLILLNVGPSRRRWRLTGNHRLAPTVLTKNNQSELQQI
jgi:hypothetical protein